MMVRNLLYLSLDTILRALSPFMPFLSEELYQRLHVADQNSPESVCIASYPSILDYDFRNEEIETDMERVSRVIHSILGCRRNYSLTKARQEVFICAGSNVQKTIDNFRETLMTLSRSSDVRLVSKGEVPDGCVTCKEDDEAVVFVKLKVSIFVYLFLGKQLSSCCAPRQDGLVVCPKVRRL